MEYFRIVKSLVESNCLEFVKLNPLIKIYNKIQSKIIHVLILYSLF